MQLQTIADTFNLPERDALRETILDTLDVWIRQRPGLDPRLYIRDWNDASGRAAYRSDARAITRQFGDAYTLLRYVAMRPGVTGQRLLDAFEGDRLTYTLGRGLDYTTNQYWPMEYRAAACRVLARALWNYWADNMTGPLEGRADKVRRTARHELGSALARRWF
jgi:hypothetical protein